MTNFDQLLLEQERELTELKTTGLKSSSSLAVTSHTLTVTQQIVGYRVNYDNDSCGAQSAAIIEVIPSDGKNMLTTISANPSDRSKYTNRYVQIVPTIKNGHNAFEFRILAGSNADLATIQGGGSIPALTFTLTITATSEFTTNITYRQDH